MTNTLERSHGAAKFYQPKPRRDGSSMAVFFSKPETEVVDSTWDRIIETIHGYYELEDDWDGNQAVAPERNLVYMAVQLARQLKNSLHPAPARALAGVNGTICFEFADFPLTIIEVVSPRMAEVYEDGKLIRIIEPEPEA